MHYSIHKDHQILFLYIIQMIFMMLKNSNNFLIHIQNMILDHSLYNNYINHLPNILNMVILNHMLLHVLYLNLNNQQEMYLYIFLYINNNLLYIINKYIHMYIINILINIYQYLFKFMLYPIMLYFITNYFIFS